MSNTQGTGNESKSSFPSISSKIKGLFSREDPNNPPPKQMKLGNSGNPIYDKEKKRWIFEGEENQDTEDLIPPPRSFLTTSAVSSTGKRKLYVDVLEEKNDDKPYKPANIEEKYEDIIEKPKGKLHQIETFKDSDKDLLKKNQEEMLSKEIDINDNYVFHEFNPSEYMNAEKRENINNEDEKSKKYIKHKQKIHDLKANQAFLKEYIISLEENSTKIHEIFNSFDLTLNLDQDTLDIQLLAELEKSKQTIMSLKADNFKIHNAHSQIEAKQKYLKQELKEKISLLEQENLKQKECYDQEAFENKLMINERNKEISNFQLLIQDYEKQHINNQEKVLSLEKNYEKTIKKTGILEIDLNKAKYEIELYKKIQKNNIEKIQDLEINKIILEDKIQLLIDNEANKKQKKNEYKNIQPIKKAKKDKKGKKDIHNRENIIMDQNYIIKTLQNDLFLMLEDIKRLKNDHFYQLESERLIFETNLNKVSIELVNEKELANKLKSQISLFKNDTHEKAQNFLKITEELMKKFQKIEKNNKNYSNEYKKLLHNQEILAKDIREKGAKIEELNKWIQCLEHEKDINIISQEEERKNAHKIHSKYKTLKDKYKIQLDTIEKQKNNINDINSVLDELINKLKASEEKIKEIEIESENKIKISEVNTIDFEREINRINSEKESLQIEIDFILKEFNDRENKIKSEYDNEIQLKSMELNELNEIKEGTNKHLSEILDENKKLLQDISILQENESMLIEKTEENQKLNQVIIEKIAENEILSQGILLKTAENEELNKEIIKLSGEIKRLDEEIVLITSEADKKAEEILILKENSLALESLSIENNSLLSLLNDSKIEINDLTESLSASQSQHNELITTFNTLQQKYSALKLNYQQIDIQNQEKLKELEDNSSQIADLTNELEEKTHEITIYKQELEKKSLELIESKKEIIEYDDKQNSIFQAHEERIKKILEDSSLNLFNQEIELNQLKKEYSEKNEDCTQNMQKITEYSEYLELQLAESKELIQEKNNEINELQEQIKIIQNNTKKIEEKKVNNIELEKLRLENKKLKEKDKNQTEEIQGLNNDIENYCEKTLNLQQKLQKYNELEGSIKEKDTEINRYILRLKEKDEELDLSKVLYQEIMKTKASEEEKTNNIVTENRDRLDEVVIAPDNTEKIPLQQQNIGWLASILSAVFLTESERKD